MSDALRCPHCKTELPEQATFCAACGRRIEGWSLPRSGTPAAGETALPGAEEATRQMRPTPSLLRAAALSAQSAKKKRAKPDPAPVGRREPQPRRSRAPLAAAMLLVAAGGGAAGFFVVRGHKRPPVVPVFEPEEAVPTVAAPTVTPPVAVPPVVAPTLTTTPTPVAAKPKAKRATNRIASAPVAVKAPPPPRKIATVPGGLPHKTVTTDSKPLQMPTVQHETTSEAARPPTEADDKQEAEARLDADGIRFVVRQHLPQVRSCYGRAFKDSSPGGTVEIGFAIDAQGHAKSVRTETNTTDSEGLARCLETRVREWQFPRPIGGDYELIYPFVFAPGS